MFKLHFYIFKFFFTIFLAVLFSIIALVGFSDFIFNYKPSVHSLSWLVENIIRSSIFSLEISIPLSFIAAFCFFNIKFSKSFELNAARALGISRAQFIKPIFYFSIFCGFLLYFNQSFLAPTWNASLLKNYYNFSPNWLVSGDKIIYSKTQAQKDIFVFSQEERKLKIEKYNNRLLEKTYLIQDNPVSSSLDSSETQTTLPQLNFSLKNNFFFLNFTELLPLAFGAQKNPVFQYIFFQKIADIFSILIILLILLGKQLHPRNLNLELETVKQACIAVLFLFTNQVGFFIFEARVASEFFSAFGNYFFWILFLIARSFSYKVSKT